MNTPPTAGYVAVRPAFDFTAPDQDYRWQEWHVIDRRNGIVICECWPPQPRNLSEAMLSLAEECEECWAGLEMVDVTDGEEISEPCQSCGALGPDIWVSPLGAAELLVGELNALYPAEVGCGYCMDCGYGGDRSTNCLHKREPTTEMLAEAAQRLRIEGTTV